MGIFGRVGGWVYSKSMAKHEVVNKILEYLDERRHEISNELGMFVEEGSNDYIELGAMFDVYDHLIAKLEDDYR